LEARLEQRVPVGGRIHHGLGGNVAAGTGPVLNDELLAEAFGQPLRHQARCDVGRAASGEPDENAHRPRRIGLRASHARNGWNADGARG